MATVGSDLPTLQDLYRKLVDAANQVGSLRSSVDSSVNNAVWIGPNADKFRTAWTGFNRTLTEIQSVLTEGSVDVKNQHNNIALATGMPDRI